MTPVVTTGKGYDILAIPAFVQPITKAVGVTSLKLQKHAPKILLGLGIAGYGATVIDGCYSSTKVPALMKEYEANHEGDKTWLYKRLVKLYGPTVALFVLSTLCVAKGYGIINERYLAAVEDAMGLREGFMMYRQAVRKDLGEDKDLEYMYGVKADKELEEKEDGIIEVKDTGEYRSINRDAAGYSIYAKVFDEYNINWRKDPQENLIFLNMQQQWATNTLRARGYLFLSEVYQALGFEDTKASRIVGWIVKPGNDNYVDFGIYNILNDSKNRFINGYEPSVILDFNVDGVIFDQIDEINDAKWRRK